MNAVQAKALTIVFLLVGFVPAYFLTSSGDRWFAVGLWLLCSVVVGLVVVTTPVLRCPQCGRATRYFDTYSDWTARLTGEFRRCVRCASCGTIIDRLSGDAIARTGADEARVIGRLAASLRMRLGLLWAGLALIFASLGVAAIIVRIMIDGNARPHRAGMVLAGCGVALVAGLALLLIAWWLKPQEEHRVFAKGIRLRSRG